MKNYTYVLVAFLTLFLKIQKHDFLRFLTCCTRFLEHWPEPTRGTGEEGTGVGPNAVGNVEM